MKHIKTFESFVNESINEAMVTLNGADFSANIGKISTKSNAVPSEEWDSLKQEGGSIKTNESTINRFEPEALDRKNEIDRRFFAKLMPRTEKTSDSAASRISTFAGNTMFVHYQHFIVKPHGNSPDRPTYRIHNSQYWLNDTQLAWQGRKGESVNVTLLTVYDITDPKNEKRLGAIYVDTKVFLDELRRVFEVEPKPLFI